MEKKVVLTDLERAVIRDCLSYGFAYDNDVDERGSFVCWGIDGRRERGALVSLHKKGVLSVFRDKQDGDTYVYAGKDYSVRDLEGLSR